VAIRGGGPGCRAGLALAVLQKELSPLDAVARLTTEQGVQRTVAGSPAQSKMATQDPGGHPDDVPPTHDAEDEVDEVG